MTRRKGPTPRRKPEPVVCVFYAAVAHRDDTEAIAIANKHTHDGVIAMAGAARTSPVRWHHVPAGRGVDVVAEHRATAAAGPSAGADSGFDDIVAFLRDHPDGLLVIAEVDIDEQRAKAHLS